MESRDRVGSVAVIGLGTMGTGIAEVVARHGFTVRAIDIDDTTVSDARQRIEASTDRAMARDKLTASERSGILDRILFTTNLQECLTSDIVIEAVPENLDEICRPGVILATITSSLPVVDLASVTSRPGDLVGLHFFNPSPVMKLVEIVDTVATSSDVVATARSVVSRIGKVGVHRGDRAGFIVNALLFPYLNDAIKMAEGNYATTDDIDTAMKVGCGYPMGPFELLDVVGLDVSLAIQQTLYREFREPGFAPAPWLEHLVTAGYTGQKAGRGFRSYA